ncbi:MAG: hypothetical protein ACI9F9_002536 [Candidatus Paceibacteria bacterium]|jgi:hypothetical protein
MRNPSQSRWPLVALAFVSVVTLTSCPAETDDPNENLFLVHNAGFGVAGGTPLAFNGGWMAYLADEASSGAQDLNGDTQFGIDTVAIAVNMLTRAETNIGVAASAAIWLGPELYVVVSEAADLFDHSGTNGTADLVLMHWNSTLTDPVFIATLDPMSPVHFVTVGSTLFYAADRAPTMAGESSLFAIDQAFPETPRPVFTQDMVDPRRSRILGEEEGLVMLYYDETLGGAALNGDGNADDTHILVLLDGTGDVDVSGYSLNMRSTGFGLTGATSPWRAANQGANDWLVGFLVAEAAQEANLNLFDGILLPLSWQIPACTVDDSDQIDEILHVIRFGVWDADSVNNPAVNTGLAGNGRVLIADDAVATICPEASENNCIFNADGDPSDRILRWIRIDGQNPPSSAGGPERTTSRLIALDSNLPGPAQAVAELDGAFVIQIDELLDGHNHDNAPGSNRKLIAWIDPDNPTPGWTFNHSTVTNFYATATWMGEQPGHTRLGVAFAESSNGDDLNGDGDQADSMPTWVDLTGAPLRLSFLGRFLATDKDNAGITLANGTGFFRFSETEHGVDENGNGNPNDILLVRVSFSSGVASNMGILNNLARLSMETEADGSSAAGAFLIDENLTGTDFNGDADAFDFVPRFFQLP